MMMNMLLPNLHPLTFFTIHLVSRLDIEGFVELRNIGQRIVCTEIIGGMRVGQYLFYHGLTTLLACPRLSVGNEESLLCSEAVNGRIAAAFFGSFECLVSYQKPAKIGNVFAKSKLDRKSTRLNSSH